MTMPVRFGRSVPSIACVALGSVLCAVLTACGGGGDEEPASTAQAAAAVEAKPAFHLAPLVLDEPSASTASDLDDESTPARMTALGAVHRTTLAQSALSLDTAGLTPQALAEHASRSRTQAQSAARPMAAAAAVVYNPAQVRAAYQFPGMAAQPATAAQRAALGAGQTIYIVNAFHNPNTLADLNAFSQRFGLPTCTALPVTVSSGKAQVRPATVSDGCTFATVYTTAAGAPTTKAPAYEAGWATEIALDVQWAHAAAPLARIVLIEAENAGVKSLASAVAMANAMGPGVVSMSFGAGEGTWGPSLDSTFTGRGMSYLAATGDSGTQVNWPSVSTYVGAVGGTTLSATATGRTETAWSRTGGGVSATVKLPAYQATLPKTTVMRRVADVAFNADPYTGQYVAITVPGRSLAWYSCGGTSLATPQWAGVLAVANAQRAAAGVAPLGASANTFLYRLAGAAPLSKGYLDVTSGANGTCAWCKARSGYDTPTGLGTPNVTALLAQLVAAR